MNRARAVVSLSVSVLLLTFGSIGHSGSAEKEKPNDLREWEQVVAAAKKEGQVAVYGGPGLDRVKFFKGRFEASFPGIRVDYEGMSGSLADARILAERRANKYTVDIYLGGPSLFRYLKANELQPVRSALILPEVLDETKWFERRLWFSDKEGKYILSYSQAASTTIAVNTRSVNPKTISSYKELILPRWRGKIVSQDLTRGGAGSGNVRFLYAHPDLGSEFLKTLYGSMDVVLSSNYSQMTDWLAQGKFAFCLFPTLNEIDRAKEVGMPVDIVNPQQMKEGYAITAGFNNILLLNPAPHPNALKVYVNWLLSRNGQAAFERMIETPSLRLDTQTKGSLRDFLIPKEGTNYMAVQDERVREMYEKEIQSLLKSIVRR